MNMLGLVFSILLILSYGFYACWDKHTTALRLRNTYFAYEKMSRKIRNSFESKVYGNLEKVKTEEDPKEKADAKQKAKPRSAPKKAPVFNRECSKINLWPLIQEGRETHPILYELAAKLIRTFYGALDTGEKRFEYYFLDILIASAKETLQEKDLFALEKIALLKPDLQRVYYKMLKGTKHWDLKQGIGYPPLQDYIKATPSDEKICVFHANPDLITVLFNSKIAWKLYGEIHQKNGPVLTEELIEKVCSEMHLIRVDPDLIKLLQLGHPDHKELKKAFIAEDEKGDVSLRKDFYLDG